MEQGVLTASRVGVDRHHRELGRFKSSTILYRVTDSAFVPDLTKVSIDAAVSLIAASLTAPAPSGEQYTNPTTGFSVEKVKEVIGALGGRGFPRPRYEPYSLKGISRRSSRIICSESCNF